MRKSASLNALSNDLQLNEMSWEKGETHCELFGLLKLLFSYAHNLKNMGSYMLTGDFPIALDLSERMLNTVYVDALTLYSRN